MTRPVIPAPSTRVVEQHSGTVLTGEALKLANDRLQVVAVGQLEELWDAEIPCSGWQKYMKDPAFECDQPATLRSRVHGCNERFKCMSCWQRWYVALVDVLHTRGYLKCPHCGQHFYDVASFSDYRPF